MPAGTRVRDGLLVSLAFGAGVVDAISLTTLGVFTAAVTANIVFVGLALGDADTHTALRAALAVAGFAVGVLVAARALRASAVVAGTAAVQVAFLAAWLASDGHPDGIALDLMACGSALAMGGQTAAASRLHPGIPPTFVTGMLTALLSDLVTTRDAHSDWVLRVAVIGAIGAGAALGAVLLADARDAVAIVPLAVSGAVAIGAYIAYNTYS
jgi:uncharacterized membrane protein YoaK (UPF0700 family)